MGLEGYGLEPGCRADLVVLEAGDPVEAIRLKAARLFVLRGGRTSLAQPPRAGRLDLPGRPPAVELPARADAGLVGTAAAGDCPSTRPAAAWRVAASAARHAAERPRSFRQRAVADCRSYRDACSGWAVLGRDSGRTPGQP